MNGYLRHIIDVDHTSVLEHGSVSIYVQDVSRSLTHELVRHRHFSYSQLSQRFAKLAHTKELAALVRPAFIVPPLFEDNDEASQVLTRAWFNAIQAYQELSDIADHILTVRGVVDRTKRVKRLREAARAVLPNMTPTSIVVTGNHLAWREMIAKRATVHADHEIRRFAIDAFQLLRELEPALYQDGKIDVLGEHPDPIAIVTWGL